MVWEMLVAMVGGKRLVWNNVFRAWKRHIHPEAILCVITCLRLLPVRIPRDLLSHTCLLKDYGMTHLRKQEARPDETDAFRSEQPSDSRKAFTLFLCLSI